MTRNELVAKIEAVREEMKTAGPIHRQDLKRYLKRLKSELYEYDLHCTSMSGMFSEEFHRGGI